MISISRQEIRDYLETKLDLSSFEDSSLNGLQIEGSERITKLAVAVDASLDLVLAARNCSANFVIVHHGLFWEKAKPITGPLKKTLEICFQSGINLFAAHLPLDANRELGNNFSIARDLNLNNIEPAYEYHKQLIGCVGENSAQLSLKTITDYFKSLPGVERNSDPTCESTPLGRTLVFPFGPKTPHRIGVVSGAGAEALHGSEIYKVDTFITGEPRQSSYHYAKEHGINVIFGGHYATETVGVINVAKDLSEKFGLPWEFIDLPTGI